MRTITDLELKALHSGLRRKPEGLKELATYVQLALARNPGVSISQGGHLAEEILLISIHHGYETLLGMAAGKDEPVNMLQAFEELDAEPSKFDPGVKKDLTFELAKDDAPPPDDSPWPDPEWDEHQEDAARDKAEQAAKLARTANFTIQADKVGIEDFRPTKEEIEKIIADKKATDGLKERIEELQATIPPDTRTREERKTDFAALIADPFNHTPKPAFTPSKYQQDIFDWVKHGSGHALVNAVAGSGKTTTVVEAAKLMKGRCLFLAFNRHIKLELAKRLPANCEVMTLNGFGWGVCRNNVRGAKMPGKYDKQKDDAILLDVLAGDDVFYKQAKKSIFRMIGLLKALGEVTTQNYMEIARQYGAELDDIKDKAKFDKVLAATYDISVERLDLFSFDDQLFQPIYRNWDLPAYDWVVIDEMQDCSPIQITLAERLAESGRILGVGDPDQSIYLFRGAHPDAMNTVAERLHATWLPLSTCYRCPDAVIKAAKAEVPRIEAPMPNAKGAGVVETIETEDFLRNVSDGDMVLCRTTAPLVKRCLEKLRDGKKAYVKGRDVSEQLIDLIEKINGRQFDRKRIQSLPKGQDDIAGFLEKLDRHWTEQAYKLERAGRDIELMMLEDKVETIKALAEDKDSVIQIAQQIDKIFSDEAQEGIAFMTGHKAKGLESQTVYILRPDLCPHPKAKQATQLRQEKNLKYVMKTRAMSELYFVTKEKDEK